MFFSVVIMILNKESLTKNLFTFKRSYGAKMNGGVKLSPAPPNTDFSK